MRELSELLDGQVRLLAFGVAFAAFLWFLFVYVTSRNFWCMRREKSTPVLQAGEQLIDRISIEWWLMRTETILTDRRVLQLRLSWFLSKRRLKCVALRDIQSVSWRSRINWILVLSGVWLSGALNPLALLLVLYGLQGKIYTVRFGTPFSSMPVTRIVVTSLWTRQLSECQRFHRNALATWSRIRSSGTQSAMAAPIIDTPALIETDFVWGTWVLLHVWIFLLLGGLQRIAQVHISYDDYLFAPLYLAIPAAVARRDFRDGVWTALLGFVALLSMKFPSSLPVISSLTGDGARSAYFEEYGLVVATMLAVAAVSSILARGAHPLVLPVPLTMWLLFVAMYMPTGIYDLGLYAKVCLAMAWSIVIVRIEETVQPTHWGRPGERVS